MSKKSSEQKLLAASLSNALNPQKKRGMPKEALDQYDDAPKASPVSSATPVTPVTDVTPVTPVTPVTRVKEDVAPKRDFTRTANSIVREAVPAGVFTGKGKQLYDYLYSQTRGYITPRMSARIPTEVVMKGAGMTRHPFRAHIHRLVSFGLVKVEERAGGHGGNVYTVYLPEEVDPGDRGDRGHTGDKVPVEQGSQAHRGDRGLSPDFQRTSDDSKTSFKTKDEKLDDEAAPLRTAFFELFEQASKDLTGKGISPAETSKYVELADLLVTELKIAAGRTTVSSVPAFLEEHLRRRLWKKEKREIEREAAENASEGDSVQVKPDSKNCPDCFGTGMYYPEGFERGVAKCSHKRLT